MEKINVWIVEEMEMWAAPKALLVQGGPGPVQTAEQEIQEWLNR